MVMKPDKALLSLLLIGSSFGVGASDARASEAFPGEGLRLVQGDIVVAIDKQGGAAGAAAGIVSRSLARAPVDSRWPGGLIPYRVDPELSAAHQGDIDTAVERWNADSSVRLVKVGKAAIDTPGALANSPDYIWFTTGDSCASRVGRHGGRQKIWVGKKCNVGSILHEIGHAIGLRHEHNRPDRDQYIKVRWENIQPKKVLNFRIDMSESVAIGDYDLDSIMHYGPLSFSIDGESPTLEAVIPTKSRMGQRIAPSAGDLAAIDELYQSDVAVTAEAMPADGGALLRVSTLSDSGAHSLELVVASDAPVAPEGEGWRCESPAHVVTCSRLSLPGAAQSTLWVPMVAGERSLSVDIHAGNHDPHRANNTATLGLDVPKTAAATVAGNGESTADGDPAADPDGNSATGPAVIDDDAARVTSVGGASGPVLATLLTLLAGSRRRRNRNSV
ncbi:MAG: hypothetical protein CSB44_04175 [Gammaproteobacteria bacterium]|nr:MAG: hypothetical protein CSB44_04175 [Gammaproteobacteria bacterium]